jgi:16S rRNA (cytosine1402-N4)-methyltransferase
MAHAKRSTPAGEHRPVLLDEVLRALAPQPGEIAVDCTLGWGGHAVELLKRVTPGGRLIGIDLDAEEIGMDPAGSQTRLGASARLDATGGRFDLHHGNFAGLVQILAQHDIERVDMVLADLGMSSMQVDDPERGFSYSRPGPLDMRMDRSRGRTAAELLATMPAEELARQLTELGDEPEAMKIATAIAAASRQKRIETTRELAQIVADAVCPDRPAGKWRPRTARFQWKTHPAARTFQVLRILVNRELANLQQLLRVLPEVLRPGGRAAIISFHSGEDRLVKAAFRDGLRTGVYGNISPDAIRASESEKTSNPRSRSAKLRWAVRK